MDSELKARIEGMTIEELEKYVKNYSTSETSETVAELKDDIKYLTAADDRLKVFEETLDAWSKGGWSKGAAGISGWLFGSFSGYEPSNKKLKQEVKTNV